MEFHYGEHQIKSTVVDGFSQTCVDQTFNGPVRLIVRRNPETDEMSLSLTSVARQKNSEITSIQSEQPVAIQ